MLPFLLLYSFSAPDQEEPSRREVEDFILENQMQRAARICLLHETVDGSLLFIKISIPVFYSSWILSSK